MQKRYLKLNCLWELRKVRYTAFSKLVAPRWNVVLLEDVREEAGNWRAPGYVQSWWGSCKVTHLKHSWVPSDALIVFSLLNVLKSAWILVETTKSWPHYRANAAIVGFLYLQLLELLILECYCVEEKKCSIPWVWDQCVRSSTAEVTGWSVDVISLGTIASM